MPHLKTNKATKRQNSENVSGHPSLAARVQRVFLLLMPLCLFFSFHPVIKLGETSVMNYELSVAEIWLVLFSLVSLINIKPVAKFYGVKKLAVAAILPVYFFLSAVWSANHFRAILTAGLFSLIVFAGLNIFWLIKTDQSSKHSAGSLLTCLKKSLILSATAISIFCLAQCILDLIGVSQQYTMLCNGCVYNSFGFPHPNGFAIEPQFMGNLLLAPALLGFYELSVYAKNKHKPLFKKPTLITLLLIITTTLFLTLSRGAIYAFCLGFLVQQIWLAIRAHKQNQSALATLIKPITLSLTAFIFAISLQGLFAAVSPTNDTFYSGITKSLHQLTLGKIDLRPQSTSTNDTESTSTNTQPTSTEPQSSQSAEQPTEEAVISHFSGYVAESTNVRLNLNSLAIKTWSSQPRYVLIGTGLGSAGIAIHDYAPEEIGAKEIIQNEYLSLLLETGLIGCATILAVIIYGILKSRAFLKAQKPAAKSSYLATLPLFLSVIFSFALTLLFFSGIPNAIHIYLFPLILISLPTKHYSVIAQKV